MYVVGEKFVYELEELFSYVEERLSEEFLGMILFLFI